MSLTIVDDGGGDAEPVAEGYCNCDRRCISWVTLCRDMNVKQVFQETQDLTDATEVMSDLLEWICALILAAAAANAIESVMKQTPLKSRQAKRDGWVYEPAAAAGSETGAFAGAGSEDAPRSDESRSLVGFSRLSGGDRDR